MNGGEEQDGFVRMLVDVIDGLIARSRHNRKSLLGPKLARDLNAWENGSVRISDAKFGDAMRELGRHMARADCRRLHFAFVDYRDARDRAFGSRKNGRIAASMKPVRAEALIEARLDALGIERVSLSDPAGFQSFIDAAVLNPSRNGQYGSASASAQALMVLLAKSDDFLGQVSPALKWPMLADVAFHLCLNGYHSGQASTLHYALGQLELADAMQEDRAIRGYRHHAANLLARHLGVAENVVEAETSLAIGSSGPLPLRPNVERAIRARYLTQHYVRRGASLDTKTSSGMTVIEELLHNRDLARSLGAMDSHVVAHIVLVETMLSYGDLDTALQHLGGAVAAMALPNARTANTVALIGRATTMVRSELDEL